MVVRSMDSSATARSQVRRHLPRVRRAGWNLGDQVLSAATNVVMSFIVARNVSAPEFGVFAVAFLIFSLVIGIERALVGEPLSMRYAGQPRAERVVTARAALGTTLALTLPVSLGLLLVGLCVGGVLGPALLALAVALPFLIIQDTCRMAFFAWGQPARATLNDAVWAVFQFAAVAAVISLGTATPASMLLAWGFGAAVAAVTGLVQLRALPHPSGVPEWIRDNRGLVGYLLAEYLLGVGAFQGGILIIGGLLGVSDIGSLRAAQVLVGPLGIISTAAATFGIPEVARLSGLPRHTLRFAGAASLGLAGLALVYTVGLAIIPGSLGVALLGDTWTGASSVLIPVALASAAASLKLGPVIFLYGRGLARLTFRLVATLAVLAVVLMALGAHLANARGLAWGLFVAQVVIVPFWFLQLRAVLRGGEAGGRRSDNDNELDPFGIGSQVDWPGPLTETAVAPGAEGEARDG
jgi:O-antigen/teichoic acid export membrane protein